MKKKILLFYISVFFTIISIVMIFKIVKYEFFSENLINQELVKYTIDEHISKEKIIKYVDNNLGFEINILEDMKLDNYFPGVVTNLSNEKISLSVFYDDFTNDLNSYDTYVKYSNNFIKDTKNHTLIEDSTVKVDNKTSHFLAYSRKKLSKLANDKNYYCSAEIKVSDKKVYTILAKTSSSDLSQVKNIINSFKFISEPNEIELEDGHFKNIELSQNAETKELYNEYFSDEANLTWGIFEPEAPMDFTSLDNIEEKINYKFKFLLRYQNFNTKLPIDEIKNAAKLGRIVQLSPQTMNTVPGEVDIYEILDGKYDEYLNEYAKDIKNLETPILFRLNNEMNGDWCGYSAYHYGKDAELYRESWKYIYNIFKENAVDNVLWIWNTNHKSFPNFSWNNAFMYYPGDEFVDIVGLTAYNTGNYYKGEEWTSFDELYLDYYKEYDRIFEKPLMITEFGSSIFGGNKVKWVEDMFKSLENYPGIKVAIWWNHIDYDHKGNESRVYRIDRPIEVLDVFKKYLKNT